MALIVLDFDRPEPLFALFPLLLLLVWYSGLAGASIGSAVLAVVGTAATLGGSDALRVLDTGTTSQIIAIQVLLATLSLSSLPLAVVLADQRRLSLELARVAEARSDFLAAMSHEIRTR